MTDAPVTDAPVRSRDLQRDASRARVLAAARELFTEQGYEPTTVRQIAERAGLSPAGVFTTFADKRDILHHVRMAQNATLREDLEAAAARLDGRVVDRLCTLVRLAYVREWPHLPLVVAYIGAQYGWSAATEADMNSDHRRLFDALRAMLTCGVTRGELRRDLDIELAVELIHGTYFGNYRTAWVRGWSAEETGDYVARKLRLLFSGFQSPA